jgi:three-Cys-motif partner protein
MVQKTNVKTNVMPHTQAKLNLLGGYLEHYLRVLNQADFCRQINLFDIYCGAGIYNDGKKGSPLLILDCIRKIRVEMPANKNTATPISLLINDYDIQKIESVKNNVNIQDIENCTIEFCNKDADDMLDLVANRLSKYPKDHRNLIFIDPYGYSDINKDKFINLLNNKCTEIILFLPVMQMYRFTEAAFRNEDKPQYEALRNFTISFLNNSDNIKIETIFEYIHSIKKALSINNSYFTCSHYVEREKGSYYALFFISSNIYGLEKMLEAKWKLDPVKGKGYNQNKNSMQMSMFDDELNKIDHLREISYLENVIYQSMKQNKIITNIELYELTLKNEFLPKHANTVLKNLITQNKIREINNSDGYKIDYSSYKNKNIISRFEVYESNKN